mgnify:CR=1 FL=1
MIIFPAFASILPLFESLPRNFSLLLVLAWYMITMAYIFENFLNWFFSVNIVTDERIFDVDFFDFTLFGRSYDRWPVFNIADAAVTIGVLVLVLFYKKHQEEDEKVEAVLEGGTSTTIQDIAVSDESTKTIQNDNSSDIIKEDDPVKDRNSEIEFLNGIMFGLLKESRSISIHNILVNHEVKKSVPVDTSPDTEMH